MFGWLAFSCACYLRSLPGICCCICLICCLLPCYRIRIIHTLCFLLFCFEPFFFFLTLFLPRRPRYVCLTVYCFVKVELASVLRHLPNGCKGFSQRKVRVVVPLLRCLLFFLCFLWRTLSLTIVKLLPPFYFYFTLGIQWKRTWHGVGTLHM